MQEGDERDEGDELVALARLAIRMPFYKAICMFTVLHFPTSPLPTLCSVYFSFFLRYSCGAAVVVLMSKTVVATLQWLGNRHGTQIGQPSGHVRFLCVALTVSIGLPVVVVVVVVVTAIVVVMMVVLLTSCLNPGP